MAYWLYLPLALFMLSPLWIDGVGSTYVGDKFQMEEVWDSGPGSDSGQVRIASPKHGYEPC